MKTYCEWRSYPTKVLVDPKQILCIAPAHNTTKPDATGAFQPEARNLLKYYGADPKSVVLIDNNATEKSQREQVLKAIESRAGELRALAIFCHGFATGIQFKFRIAHVDALASAIVASAGPWLPNLNVVLYACDAAKDNDPKTDDVEAFGGDGGFADRLRDAICVNAKGDWSGWVDAHTTAGHTTQNPNLRRFEGMGSMVGLDGGHYIVHPEKGKALWRAWRQRIAGTSFRYEAPFLTVSEIHQYLNANP